MQSLVDGHAHPKRCPRYFREIFYQNHGIGATATECSEFIIGANFRVRLDAENGQNKIVNDF